MEGAKANLVVTDPPYNVDYEGSAGKIRNDHMENEQFYNFLLDGIEKLLDLRRLKAGEGHIKVRILQVSDKVSQQFLIPFASDLIEGDVQRLLLPLVNVNDDAVNFLIAQIREDCGALVGDVWTLGRHRLVVGDSTLPETYDVLMAGAKANLGVTSCCHW